MVAMLTYKNKQRTTLFLCEYYHLFLLTLRHSSRKSCFFDLTIFSFPIFCLKFSEIMKTNFLTLLSPYHLPELAGRITGPVDPEIHPSITDPVASIISPGFRKKKKKKTSPGWQIFHQVCCFVRYVKSRPGEATNWPGKISSGTGKAKFSLDEGKKSTCSGFTESVTEGCPNITRQEPIRWDAERVSSAELGELVLTKAGCCNV